MITMISIGTIAEIALGSFVAGALVGAALLGYLVKRFSKKTHG